MKTIDTLVDDIYEVVSGKGGWDETVNDFFKNNLGEVMTSRLTTEHPEGNLRLSSIGQPCVRKLWYSVNEYDKKEELEPHTRLKFLYGDVIEEMLLSLAVAAGHRVEGRQDTLTIAGIKGHRDAVIDGVTVDVKSASSFSFSKFKNHELEKDDPFGYLPQLGSYVIAGKEDPLVEDKDRGAFLAMDKQHGYLCLDTYNFKEMGYDEGSRNISRLIEERKSVCNGARVPPRGYNDIPEGKSGNRKLVPSCSYCQYKGHCWPGLRTFIYGSAKKYPVFLTTVKRAPKVPEIK